MDSLALWLLISSFQWETFTMEKAGEVGSIYLGSLSKVLKWAIYSLNQMP